MTKTTYEARPDVAWVNGKPVPKNRRVELTEAEAGYDLSLGRIAPVGSKAKPKSGDKLDEPAQAQNNG
ncbi:hypothetical protein GCM10007989_04960 [Devosia pacifica]|uniref:Uncharacterized protein n=1 Tax=Devosia pacifica TaxID=1335967 RepID=A0A918RY93_9HYPH|nr:hypothetical protein [Devosia pacifica]GHA13367.1 hypothetical protein GCM10007989_04960 [Devosia pacifica]